jgi:hypothetical protein
MPNLEPFDHLLKQTEAAQAVSTATEAAFEAAKDSARLTRSTSEETIFNELVTRNTRLVEGEQILTLAEASMRLAGIDALAARNKTEQLAKLILPPVIGEPLPFAISARGSCLEESVGVLGGSHLDQHTFAVSDNAYHNHQYALTVHGPQLVRDPLRLPMPLASGSSDLTFQVRDESNELQLDFSKIKIIDDPERVAGKYAAADNSIIFLGKEAVMAAIPNMIYPYEAPEAAAARAYVSMGLGENITKAIPTSGQTHETLQYNREKQSILDSLAQYVTEVLNAEYGAAKVSPVDLRANSLPLIAHPAALEAYDISVDEATVTILKGIGASGLITERVLRDIKFSKGGGSSIGEILDNKLESTVRKLNHRLKDTKQAVGIIRDPASVVTAAIKNPKLYQEICYVSEPRNINEGDLGVVYEKIAAHFRSAKRYKTPKS